MQYREYGRTAIKVSPLGFGCMRLPMENDHVKEEYTIKMLRHAMDLGVNYFDTGVDYCKQESQIVLGKAIKGRRDKLYISTKNPHKGDDSKEWRRLLEESLERLDIDYIDFYHCHGLKWEQYVEGFSKGPIKEARKALEEGLFRYLCFSSHDWENIPKLIDTGEFAGMTVQYNLLDHKNEEAIAMAHEKGMGVVIMGRCNYGTCRWWTVRRGLRANSEPHTRRRQKQSGGCVAICIVQSECHNSIIGYEQHRNGR